MLKCHTVYISAGSNIGDGRVNCEAGIAAVQRKCSARIERISGFYRTEPQEIAGQDWFSNAVVRINTSLKPKALLRNLKKIETDAGRDENTVRYGPRVIDLDILFYDDIVIESEDLTIPHPKIHKRMFVLKPFCDIDPQFRHPVLSKTMATLMEELEKANQKVICESWD